MVHQSPARSKRADLKCPRSSHSATQRHDHCSGYVKCSQSAAGKQKSTHSRSCLLLPWETTFRHNSSAAMFTTNASSLRSSTGAYLAYISPPAPSPRSHHRKRGEATRTKFGGRERGRGESSRVSSCKDNSLFRLVLVTTCFFTCALSHAYLGRNSFPPPRLRA